MIYRACFSQGSKSGIPLKSFQCLRGRHRRWKPRPVFGGVYTNRQPSYLPKLTRFGRVNQFGYPSLRYPWQQIPYTLPHRFLLLLPHLAYDPRSNRTRLPELDEKSVKVHPLPVDLLSSGLFVMGRFSDENGVVTDVDCDPLEIHMFGCNGLECLGDP